MTRHALLGRWTGAGSAGFSHFIMAAAAVAVERLLIVEGHGIGDTFDRDLRKLRQ